MKKWLLGTCLLTLPLFARFEEIEPEFEEIAEDVQFEEIEVAMEEVVAEEEIVDEIPVEVAEETPVETAQEEIEVAIEEIEVAEEELALELVEEEKPHIDHSLFLYGSHQFYIDDEDHHMKVVLSRGLKWENEVEKILRERAFSGARVIDVGADIGIHTVTLSESVGFQGEVFAFEADTTKFSILELNMNQNQLSNVKLYGGEKLFDLDRLGLENIALMRINAWGREDQFLKGASRTIKRSKPVIIIKLLGGIPESKIDKYQRKELEERRKTMERLGYHLQKITETDYLALPM